MKFVLLGRYQFAEAARVAQRAKEVYENPPRGLEIVNRYSAVGKNLIMAVINAEDTRDIAALLLMFGGLVRFEVIPVFEVREQEAIDLTSRYREMEMPMHGPL